MNSGLTSSISMPVNKSIPLAKKLTEILNGHAKPASETEALASMSAMMWKKTLETAMTMGEAQSEDSVTNPTSKLTKELTASQLGIQMAVQLQDSWISQLGYLKKGAIDGASAQDAYKK